MRFTWIMNLCARFYGFMEFKTVVWSIFSLVLLYIASVHREEEYAGSVEDCKIARYCNTIQCKLVSPSNLLFVYMDLFYIIGHKLITRPRPS